MQVPKILAGVLAIGRAGFGVNSKLHAVGDGASWIANQVEERFGDNGRYLVDFWHVCDYLGAAAKTIAPTEAVAKNWREAQKERLKQGQAPDVLDALQPYLEPSPIGTSQTGSPSRSTASSMAASWLLAMMARSSCT